MKYIAHRGLFNGPNKELENNPTQIDFCISKGYDAEIDLNVIDSKYFLGHDYPRYPINLEFLYTRKSNLWIHCKNIEALSKLYNTEFNYFWHQNDDYVITSKQFIWTYPGKQMNLHKNQIILDFSENIDFDYYSSKIYGICCDYIK